MTHTREALHDAATAKMREVLATLNDAVTDAGNDILVASNASADPETDSRMVPLFKVLRKRERERDHARNLLNAMEDGRGVIIPTFVLQPDEIHAGAVALAVTLGKRTALPQGWTFSTAKCLIDPQRRTAEFRQGRAVLAISYAWKDHYATAIRYHHSNFDAPESLSFAKMWVEMGDRMIIWIIPGLADRIAAYVAESGQ